jgi:hypothetical protein
MYDWLDFVVTACDDVITDKFVAGIRSTFVEAFPLVLSRWISGVVQATNAELIGCETSPPKLCRQLHVLLRITRKHADCLPSPLLLNAVEIAVRVVTSCWNAAMRAAPVPKPRSVTLPDSFEEFMAMRQRIAEERAVDEHPCCYSLKQDCFAVFGVISAHFVHIALQRDDVDVALVHAVLLPFASKIRDCWSQLPSLNSVSAKGWAMSPVSQVIHSVPFH